MTYDIDQQRLVTAREDVISLHTEVSRDYKALARSVDSLLSTGWEGRAAEAYARGWGRLAGGGEQRPRRPRGDGHPPRGQPQRVPAQRGRHLGGDERRRDQDQDEAVMSFHYMVDLDKLDESITDMGTFDAAVGRHMGTLDSIIAKLHGHWQGEAAAAQKEAHARWNQGRRGDAQRAHRDARGRQGGPRQLPERGRYQRPDVETGPLVGAVGVTSRSISNHQHPGGHR